MRPIICAAVVATALLTTGCASQITAWKNRGVASHSLTPGRFFTLTGERRLAFQAEKYDPLNPPEPWYDKRNKRWVKRIAWCAESLPEASQAVSASSKPNLKFSKNGEIGTDDTYATTLLQTFTRTEVAEVYRQMSWQACQAWAQGVYSDEHYAQKLDDLLTSGMKVIEIRAGQPLTPSAASKADETKSDKKATEVKAEEKKAGEVK